MRQITTEDQLAGHPDRFVMILCGHFTVVSQLIPTTLRFVGGPGRRMFP